MTTYLSRANRQRGLIFVVLAGILWGTSGVATKGIYSLVAIHPMSVAAFRLASGAPLLLLAAGFTAGYRSFRVTRTDLAVLLLVGAMLGGSQACYYAAIARVGVAIATLVTICTAPVLVSLLAGVLLRERLTLAMGGALVCALIGTALLVGVQPGAAGMEGTAAVSGLLLALAAAAGFAVFILGSRRLANRYHPLQSIAMAASVGAILLLTISAVTTGIQVAYPAPAWALLLYLGLVPTALAHGLFFHGVKDATAAEASIGSLAEPLTSTGLAFVLFGERLGPLGWLGALLLISVLVFLYRNGSSEPG